MSNTYFIRGTISVQAEGARSRVLLTPCTGFLSPDKKKAIAFPLQDDSTVAMLTALSGDKNLDFDAAAIKGHMPGLLAIAAQQKAIELHFEENAGGWKVMGFVFPV
jgi:hypothetical protein